MAFIYDAKKGQVVPIHVAIRDCQAAESNTRIPMQRQALADQIRIQHLCIRFANMFRVTVENSEKISWANWNTVTTPSLVALERKHRAEIKMWQEDARVAVSLQMAEDVFEMQSRALLWRRESHVLAQHNNFYSFTNVAPAKTFVALLRSQFLAAAALRFRRGGQTTSALRQRYKRGDVDAERRWLTDFVVSRSMSTKLENLNSLCHYSIATILSRRNSTSSSEGNKSDEQDARKFLIQKTGGSELARIAPPMSCDFHRESRRQRFLMRQIIRTSSIFTYRTHVHAGSPTFLDQSALRLLWRSLPHPHSCGTGIDDQKYHANLRADFSSPYHRHYHGAAAAAAAAARRPQNLKEENLPLWDCFSIRTAARKKKPSVAVALNNGGGAGATGAAAPSFVSGVGDSRTFVVSEIVFHVGTRVRLQRFQCERRLRAAERLFFMRHIQPRREAAALHLQRVARGAMARSVLRVPMTRIFAIRASAVIVRVLRRWVAIARAKRERLRLSYIRAWPRSLAASVDRGVALRIFVALLQQFVRAAIAARLRAALHVVHRVEEDQLRRRFYMTSSARLRLRIRRHARDAVLRRRERSELEAYCAIKIQAFWRSLLCRVKTTRRFALARREQRAAQDLREHHNYCALCIQRSFRRMLAHRIVSGLRRVAGIRRAMSEFLQLQHYAASVIRRCWLRWAAMAQMRREMAEARELSARLRRERLERLNRKFDRKQPNPFASIIGSVGQQQQRADNEGDADDTEYVDESAILPLRSVGSRLSRVHTTADRRDATGNATSGVEKNSNNRNNKSARSSLCSAGVTAPPSARDIQNVSNAADAAMGRRVSMPVAPSAFAWLRGLPHAQIHHTNDSNSTSGMRPRSQSDLDLEEAAKAQRKLRLKRAAEHNRQVCAQMSKLISQNPLEIARQTRAMLRENMNCESAMDQIGKGLKNDENKSSVSASSAFGVVPPPPPASSSCGVSELSMPHCMMFDDAGDKNSIADNNASASKKRREKHVAPAAKKTVTGAQRFIDTRRMLMFDE